MEIQVPGAGTRGLTRAAGALAAVALCAVAAGCGRGPDDAGGGSDRADEPAEVVLTPEAAREGRAKSRDEEPKRKTKAQVVELRGAGAEQSFKADPTDDAPSPGAPTDAEVREELREARAALTTFKKHLNTTAFLQTGAWRDNGYDCSGSVSFALAGAGLLNRPLTSGLFMNYGAAGQGRWITIYANSGHIFMVIAGLRFDTSGQGRAGTRWQEESRSTAGFAVRHIPGL
jgi:hypothetical protein